MPMQMQNLLMQNAIEPMQVDAPPEDNENDDNGAGGGGGAQLAQLAAAAAAAQHQQQQQPPFPLVENATLDLDAYAAMYAGPARLYRLSFVAERCPALRVEALRMAVAHAQTTYDVGTYQRLHKRLVEACQQPHQRGGGGRPQAASAQLPDVAESQSTSSSSQQQQVGGGATGGVPPMDMAWVEARAKRAALKLEKLDSDLKNYKSNSIKESIRRGHDDLGDHFLDCGDLSNALKCYSRARDYCTSGRHVVNMCLNVIKVSVYLQNWSHVISYVSKAEGTPDISEAASTAPHGSAGGGGSGKESAQGVMTRLKCAAGLAELATKKYKSAARHFLAANLDHVDFPELLCANNVALYGGLCALATFDRGELQKQVIFSGSFKLFLELEPQLRDVIFKFYESKYASCLRLLDEIRDNLLLDMYLAPHLATLYTMIRNRALIQYFSPYLSADMCKMAAAFNRTVPALEDELMQLILDGQIQARIDSHNKILYAKDVDQRSTTFERSLAVGKEYQRRTSMLILRAAMLKNQIHVKNVVRETGHQGGEAPGSSTSVSMMN